MSGKDPVTSKITLYKRFCRLCRKFSKYNRYIKFIFPSASVKEGNGELCIEKKLFKRQIFIQSFK